MAGVKGRSGGARPGAGRKPAPPVLIQNGDGIEHDEKPVDGIMAGDGKDPMQFLEGVMSNASLDAKLRVEAAKILMPFKHVRKGEAGKKVEKNAAAKKASGGKFSAAAPPLRVVGSNR